MALCPGTFVIVFHREESFDKGGRGQGLGYGFAIDFAETVSCRFPLVMVVASVWAYFRRSRHEGYRSLKTE
jgi:hypothetical protein